MGRLTLILGGARSGKSTHAERLASERGQNVLYIATAQALDGEMAARIRAHKDKRSQIWRTLEIPSRVGEILQNQDIQAAVVLLDCLTLLISNLVMEASPDVDQPDESGARALVEAEIAGLKAAIEASRADWIVVSNEVGLGLVPPYPLGRLYRDLLGWANQALAAVAGEIYFMVAGIPTKLT